GGPATGPPLPRTRRFPPASCDVVQRLPQDGRVEQDLRVLVVEDVHLPADLVDLVDVVACPLELRLDERAPEVDGRPGGLGAQLVACLLEGAQADGRTQGL